MTIPEKMTNDESKLVVSVITAQRDLVLAKAKLSAYYAHVNRKEK